MKSICLTIFVLFFCLFSGLRLRAQESPVFHRNFIGFTLSQVPFLDYRFSYERRFLPSHGIKLELGYKPAIRYFTDATIIDLGQNTTGWCYRNTASWYYLSLGYRYYFNEKKTAYLSSELFYKLMTADMIMYSWGLVNSDYSRNAFEVRSMHTNCLGLNLLVGKRMPIHVSDGFNMGLDIYGGFSVRTKFIHTVIYGHTEVNHYHDEGVGTVSIPVSDNPVITDSRLVQAMFQAGLIIFVSWK
jgi:hypothetical protein